MFSQQLAFPNATGAGAYVTGGRGNPVYHVTNLNNSGAGSFRDAISVSNRIIVFDVSGTIELTSSLTITADNLTIAGQSAPQGGITITGGIVYLQNIDNFIIRFIRFRPDYNSAGNIDALNADNLTNVIIDHCSISWGGDEAFSITGTSSNVTVQNCIFGESATGMLGGDSNNPTSDNLSVIGNLWYNISHRFPNVNALRTDLINNVVHNWFTRLKVVSAHGNVELNEINNFYQSGTKTGAPLSPDWSINWLESEPSIRIYTDGNVYPGYLTEAGDNRDLYRHRFTWTIPSTDYWALTPFALLGETPTIVTAAQALIDVPLNSGANKYLNSDGSVGEYHDDVDATYITNVTNGTSENYSYPPTDIVNKQSYIDFHNSVSSTPINTRAAGYDTNNDGMPDTWKIAKGFGVSDNLDAYAWASGYVGVEEFLNQIDGATSNIAQVNAGSDIDICEGEQATVVASGVDSYTWSNGETTASFTVTPTETTTYIVTGTDSDGNETTDSVTVNVNPLPTANAGGDVEICENSEVQLNASGGDTYSWSNGEITQNIIVSPQSTTTYTVTVTTNGCSSTDNVIVIVKPRPTINAGNDVDIYLSESATLTAIGEGAFEWNTGETTESITVTPIETTTYSVTATLNGCTNTDSIIVTILNNQETVQANAGEDSTICEGESVTLMASGGSNYLWNTGETTQSIEVSPTETTSYTVTVSDENSNSDTDDVVVSVNPTPIAYAGDDQSILHGQAITLSASGGSEFIWSIGETTQQISVHPTENTTYTVEVIQDGCSDFDSVDVIVNVVANIVDDITICQGVSTTLSASGGSNYLWSNGESTQSIEVSPTQTTTFTVIVSNGTSSDTASVVVNVNLLPNANAGGDVSLEEGNSVTLSATGGNSYLWSTGETSQNISVNPSETSIYTVEAIVNGCSDFDNVTVSVVQLVNADAGVNVEACIGETVTLTASGGEYFEWNTNETTASISVSPIETTTYSVSVSNGISTHTAEVMVFVENCSGLAIDENPEFLGFAYQVYPNPSSGEVNIKLSGLENISSIYITDILGKTIKTETIDPNNGLLINKSYNLFALSKGMYFVTFVQSGEEAITKKLILK